MKENFDCTQFVTFNSSIEIDIKKMFQGFENIGFSLIEYNDIREIKKSYFNKYIGNYFAELKNDNFIGEFEDWEDVELPPKSIKVFAEELRKILLLSEIKDVKVILTSFAEEEETTIAVIKSSSDNLIKELFNMSKHNYDIWVDNMVIELDNE